MATTSLKATKQQAHSPSKVDIVLSDSVKLSLAPIVSEASSVYQFGIDYEKMTMSKQEREQVFAHNFVSYVKDNSLNYADYQAVKKHIQQSIATSKKQSVETVEKWLNKIVKSYMAIADLEGFTLPKAESKNAVAMSALRAELASVPDSEIVKQIESLAKQGDKESLRKATQLATEKAKREKQAQNAIKKTESKNTTEMKNALKKFITGATVEQLAVMAFAKNNLNVVAKLMKG